MSVITTGSFPKSLRPGVYSWTQMKYNEHKPLHPLMFTEASSQMAYEELVAGNPFGLAPIKTQGGQVQYATESQANTTRATHITYALGFITTLEEAEDNLYEKLGKRRGARLAQSFVRTKETAGANVFNRAFNNSYTYGDGVELCSTAHPTVAGNQSNELATAADMSEASIEDLCIQIRKATDPVGNLINLMPKRLAVAPANKFEAVRILKSELQNDTANNAINALRTTGVIPEMFDNPYFTDDDAFFILTDVSGDEGLIYFNRSSFRVGYDGDSGTLNEKTFGYERYSFTCGDWRAVYGSPGV